MTGTEADVVMVENKLQTVEMEDEGMAVVEEEAKIGLEVIEVMVEEGRGGAGRGETLTLSPKKCVKKDRTMENGCP